MAALRFYPLTGLKSLKQPEAGGAWRLFVLAKNISGVSDHISRNELQQAAQNLGVDEIKFKRWLDAGRRYDLFTDVQRMSGEWMLILPSWKKVAQLFDCKLDKPVTLPAELLFKRGWRAYVFAAWQSAYTGNGSRLVSQKKQAQVTGIDPQTQRQFNEQAGVRSQRNFAISNIHANGFAGVYEFGNRACLFEYWSKETHQKHLGWRIPDTRVFPLFGTDFSNSTSGKMRLFNRTAEQNSQTLKAIRKLMNDDKQVTSKEYYTLSRKSAKGNDLWIHAFVQS